MRYGHWPVNFAASLLPEGWLSSVLHARDERAMLRSRRRCMSKITVAENADELAALPLDVITTPLADQRLRGLATCRMDSP